MLALCIGFASFPSLSSFGQANEAHCRVTTQIGQAGRQAGVEDVRAWRNGRGGSPLCIDKGNARTSSSRT